MAIKFDDVEKAVAWLRDNAIPAAKARAERLYLEQWLKTILAEEMKQHAELSAAAQEREARASGKFMAALQAYRESVETDYTNVFLREAASAKLEAWRTQESTRRAEGKAYS